MIDLEKAIDTLNHNRLLQQLEKCGFTGEPFSLSSIYLENRQQYVEHNRICSLAEKLKRSAMISRGSYRIPNLHKR